MTQSESLKNLCTALVNFQAAMKPLILDRDVKVRTADRGYYEFSYATFKNVISTCRDLLSKNGLSVSQLVGDGVTTILMHTSGEWLMTDPLKISPTKATPQAIGSSISYAKRYAYVAILGLVADDDDDGNIAEQHTYEEVDRIAAGTNYNQGDIHKKLDAIDKDPTK